MIFNKYDYYPLKYDNYFEHKLLTFSCYNLLCKGVEMKKKLVIITFVIIVSGVIGSVWYQNADIQKYVKVQSQALSEFRYNAPTDYLLLLTPIDGDEKEGEEITYIAPITALDAKPKVAYSTEGTYNYLYNNLYQTNKNEFQLYDESHQTLKTITFTDAEPVITEESKKIDPVDDQIIISFGNGLAIQKEDLYHEFAYFVKINDKTYQIYNIVSMSDYYQKNDMLTN